MARAKERYQIPRPRYWIYPRELPDTPTSATRYNF